MHWDYLFYLSADRQCSLFTSHSTMMMATEPSQMMMMNNRVAAHVQLRKWIEGESNMYKNCFERGAGEYGYKLMILRRTTVAYGIAELLKLTRSRCSSGLALPPTSLNEQFNIDNFIVWVHATAQTSHPCSDIEGG
jgi:hypothetical protein